MLQMQFLRPHPVLQNQKLWEWAHVVYFNKPSRWLWWMAKHGTTSNEQSAERWVHGRMTTLSKLHYVSVSFPFWGSPGNSWYEASNMAFWITCQGIHHLLRIHLSSTGQRKNETQYSSTSPYFLKKTPQHTS